MGSRKTAHHHKKKKKDKREKAIAEKKDFISAGPAVKKKLKQQY